MYIKAMKKAAFLTLGCRVNQYETQCIREALFTLGFEEAGFEEPCDLYLVNTCAVTAESVRKGRQMIRRALRDKQANPKALVCVCGCFSQGVEDEVLLEVDVLAGNTQKSHLPAILAKLADTPLEERQKMDLREDILRVKEYENMSLCRSHNARAFVKIQDGCNSFCSYCFVPFVRGRVRSRALEEVCSEVQSLAQNGYREVVLTGIETGTWGEDLFGKADLLSLVEAVHKIEGIDRIRFGSLKPTLFSDEFCRKMASFEKVLPHFHLSLQSGSTRILEKMGRKYTREDELSAIETIYRYFPDAGLSADLICGFPDEREEDFEESVSLVRRANLLHTHIFPFSPRSGTRAETMEPKISEEIKKARALALLEEAKAQSRIFHKKRVGKCYKVLCERVRDGYMLGYTENFIYTKTPAPENAKIGEVYSVILSDEADFNVETMTVFSQMLPNC
jgi:threonylcarbamoyladenosine tRNA methylthiotransferase MtaB